MDAGRRMRPGCASADHAGRTVTFPALGALSRWMHALAPCRSIRVLVVDDHEIVRAGIGGLLDGTAGIEVVGLARDGREAIALAAEQAPDVVLMDLQMPVVDGIEATRSITRAPDGPAVVVLTSFADEARVAAAFDSGAVGYLLKDAEPAQIVAGVRAAAGGESPLAPRVAGWLVRERRMGVGASASAVLTDRERQVLALVAAGVSNKQIARRLGISDKTVKSHLTHAFRNIGVSDRLQAARWAQRHGLAHPD